MSSIGLSGLDAMLRGALVAAVIAPAGLWLAWRAARGLPRGRRVVLAAAAAYGAAAGLGCLYSLVFERYAYQDEAQAGALVVALPLLVVIAPIFYLFTPRS